MASSSASFPSELDSTILSSISGYLRGLLKRDDVGEDAKDSVGIAVEVIEGLVSDSGVSDDSVSLSEVFAQYASQVSSQARDDFLTFMRQLVGMGFLKGVEPGSEVFRERLEAAHRGYSEKFPTKKLPSLDQLNITYEDLTQESTDKESADASAGDASSLSSASIVTEDQKKQAEKLKNEGNNYLKAKQIDKAILAYTKGIELDPTNAILYSNRAAALSHQKDYVGAAEDARKATEIDPEYVKAYIRLAVAEEQLGNYQEAYDCYSEALKRVKPTSSEWDKYAEKQQSLKRKLDVESAPAMSSGAPGMPPFGGFPGLGGGMPSGMGGGGMDFASMLGALGGGAGAGGAGGMDGLAGLMQNPMVQQMAQSMMQNPQMMQQMQSMMQDPSKMAEMSEMMQNPEMMSAMGDLMSGSQGSEIQELGKWFMENPTEAKAAMEEAMHDPEVLEMKADPTVSSLFDRLQSGDMSCMAELAQQPALVSKMMRVAKKYIK